MSHDHHARVAAWLLGAALLVQAGCLKEAGSCKQDSDCFASERCSANNLCVLIQQTPDMRSADMPVDMARAPDMQTDMNADMRPDMEADMQTTCASPTISCSSGCCMRQPPPDAHVFAEQEGATEHAIAVDASGYPHIARIREDNSLEYVRWTGAEWAFETLPAASEDIVAPRIVLDGDTAHILYIEPFQGTIHQVTRQGSGSWDTQVVFDVEDYPGVDALDELVVRHDARGLRLAVLARDLDGYRGHVFFKNTLGGVWSDSLAVIWDAAGCANITGALGPSGAMHIVGECTVDSEVKLFHTSAPRDDIPIQHPELDASTDGFGVAIAFDAGGVMYLVYRTRGALYTSTRSQGSWRASALLPSSPSSGYSPLMRSAPNGALHLVHTSYADDNIDALQHHAHGMSGWRTLDIVGQGPNPLHHAIAVDSAGALHALHTIQPEGSPNRRTRYVRVTGE